MERRNSIPVLLAILLFPVMLLAGSAPLRRSDYESALITKMRMVQCSEPPRHGNFLTGIVVGGAPAIPMANAECPEYEIEGRKVFYRIRPRRDVLLPVGEEIRFRIHKRDLLVLTEDANKELVFSVVEMTLKTNHGLRPAADQSREIRSRNCLSLDGNVVPCGGAD